MAPQIVNYSLETSGKPSRKRSSREMLPTFANSPIATGKRIKLGRNKGHVPSNRVSYNNLEPLNYPLPEEMTTHSPVSTTESATPIQTASTKRHVITPRSSMIDFQEVDKAPIIKARASPERIPIVSIYEKHVETGFHDSTASSVRKPLTLTESCQQSALVSPEESSSKTETATKSAFKTIRFIWLFLILALVKQVSPLVFPRTFMGDNSVYVPGGGFSGFWYTLGRLRSIPDPLSKQYYCYSAGCLGVVATFGNYSMEEMYRLAKGTQVRWLEGDLPRHDVVAAFLDGMLFSNASSTESHMNDPNLLSKLNVITTAKRDWFGISPEIRKPDSVESLRTMLLQTTWIPFAVGRDLWHEGHMDGAFSMAQHPSCANNVGLSMDLDLYLNVVNMNLSQEKVQKFWRKGLSFGL